MQINKKIMHCGAIVVLEMAKYSRMIIEWRHSEYLLARRIGRSLPRINRTMILPVRWERESERDFWG